MKLPKSFEEMNKYSQGPLTQGEVLRNYISNPTTNLAGFGKRSSSYEEFIKKLARTDRESAHHLLNDTAIELWKEEQKMGKYENPRNLSYAVVEHIKGRGQEDLENRLEHLRETDFERFTSLTDEIAYLSDMTMEAMYGPGGFMLAGGPAPSKSYEKAELLFEPEDPYPVAVNSAAVALLEILSENKPNIVYKERRLREAKPMLEVSYYDSIIKPKLKVAGKNANKIFDNACKKIKKRDLTDIKELKNVDLTDRQILEVQAAQETFIEKENYHPGRVKVVAAIAGTAVALTVGERLYNMFTGGGIIPTPTPEKNEEGEYARSNNLPENIIKTIQNADADNKLSAGERTMIDYLATLDTHHQQQVVDAVYKDGILSSDEADNMIFLSRLPKDQAATIIERGDAANCDLDKPQPDGICNLAEQTFGMPWDEYNGRYALLFDTGSSTGEIREMENFLIKEQKFLPENIIRIISKNATKENFEKAISDLSKKVSERDILVACLKGHAYPTAYIFNDGRGENRSGITMTYIDMDKNFDTIKSYKTLISIFACYSENAPKYLKAGPSPRVVVDIQPHWFFSMSEDYPSYEAPPPSVFDIKKDGYVTVGESIKTASEYQGAALGVTVEDIDNIADTFILGDYKISEMS